MINVHGLRRNVKNVVKNYSEAQVKVREATSNDPWGPSGTLMGEIADLTYNVVAFSEIMQVIWKRLNDHGKNWKHVYKALVLLDYLIKTGSEKVTQQCKENIFAIQTLKDFQYFEESKDQGVNVREKAKQLVALLKDDERLKNERARAIKARERFALSASLARPDPLPRQIGSSDYNQASFDEENAVSLTALSLSELEQARPQTMGEEELQLQLALAMSREEADQAEKQRRNDDLRLQMALSESQEEFKRKVPEPNASAIDDLLGINVPLATSTSPVPLLDPWGMPIISAYSSKDTNVMDDWDTPNSVTESNHETMRNDPWSPCSENLIDNGDLNAEFLASSEENKNTPYGMRKSMSADISRDDGPKSLDDFLNSKSNLIHIDGTRPRNIGNPFQAAKPPPPTINEMRGQNGTSPRPPNSDFLPSSNSMPFFPQNNPFL